MSILFILIISSIILNSANAADSMATVVPTKIRVYLHEFQSGPNATTYEVARASITAPPINFGSVRVANVLMTSGPDINSAALGRAEGLIAFSGRAEGAALLHLEFMFQAGKYNGSSISLSGRKRAADVTDEVPIAGGTGQFRMARGYVLSYTYSYDPLADYIIIVYDFNVYFN